MAYACYDAHRHDKATPCKGTMWKVVAEQYQRLTDAEMTTFSHSILKAIDMWKTLVQDSESSDLKGKLVHANKLYGGSPQEAQTSVESVCNVLETILKCLMSKLKKRPGDSGSNASESVMHDSAA